MKEGAEHNDLLERLAADPEWGVPLKDMQKLLDPSAFVGRAPQQVDEFLREVVNPLLEGGGSEAPARAEEVRV